MEMTALNGNGANAANTDAVITGNARNTAIVLDADQVVKRERRNRIRRIRRALRKDGIDLHNYQADYFPVSVHRYALIDVEQYGRKVGAIQPIGVCGVCHRAAWHRVEGLELCDSCAAEVR
jgi:hypothetical protein